MKDDFKELVQAISIIGGVAAQSIPAVLRIARRQARLVVPEECAEHQECVALRITALTLVTNGLMILKRSTMPEKVDDLVEENIRFAKFLIEEHSNSEDTEEDENVPSKKWMTDEQLKRMFN